MAESKTEKTDAKAAAKNEKTDTKAAVKNEKTDTKAAAKNERTSEKAEKDTPEEVTPVEPKSVARVVSSDAAEVEAQDGPRATAQDAPVGVPMGAVNDSNPSAATNRFSGIYPNNTYPLVDGALDEVQEQRKQARDEGARTRRVSSNAPRDPHPPLASKFTTNDHAVRRAEAEAEDVVA